MSRVTLSQPKPQLINFPQKNKAQIMDKIEGLRGSDLCDLTYFRLCKQALRLNASSIITGIDHMAH